MKINNDRLRIFTYLPPDTDQNIWEMSVSSIGFQPIRSQECYPPKGHPLPYAFNPEYGRILDEFVLVYITKGEGYFLSNDHPEEKITKGDAFILFPGQWHSYYPHREIGWDEYYVTFRGAYFEKLLSKIINPHYPVFHIGINDQIVKHFGEMLDCARAQRIGYQAVLSGITIHIIGILYSINKSRESLPESILKMQEACALIQENIYNKVTPEDIAQAINMGYSNFRKSFKQYTGIAPHQYILQLKLNKIKELLSNTQMSMKDISITMNFESPDYFSFFFRSKTGINPLSYRREIEKQRKKAQKA